MRPDRLLLQNIADAVKEIGDAIPSTQHAFDSDKFRAAFILRQIQIIGEACWRLSDALKAQHPQVPWKSIAGMRHVLVHDYFDVNWRRVYEAARDDVPIPRARVESILNAFVP